MALPDRRIDWPGLMCAGLLGLGLHPRDFWALTPLELMVMLGREGVESGFSRASLETLMTKFPDRIKQGPGGSTHEQS
jgi:uncharacterized phage protein (TIGR02216 family)